MASALSTGKNITSTRYMNLELELANGNAADSFRKVFEDPGELASGSTSAVYDAKRGRLFVHGVSFP